MSNKKQTEQKGFLKSSHPIDITGDLIGAVLAILFFGGAFLYFLVWPIVSLLGYLSLGFFAGLLRSFGGIL